MFNSSKIKAIVVAGTVVFGWGLVASSDAVALNLQGSDVTVGVDEDYVSGYKIAGLSFNEQELTETFLLSEGQANTASSLHVQFQPFNPVEVSEPQSNFGILAFGVMGVAAVLRRGPSRSAEA